MQAKEQFYQILSGFQIKYLGYAWQVTINKRKLLSQRWKSCKVYSPVSHFHEDKHLNLSINNHLLLFKYLQKWRFHDIP